MSSLIVWNCNESLVRVLWNLEFWCGVVVDEDDDDDDDGRDDDVAVLVPITA